MKKRKKALTLIEMMLVIVLIGTVGGALAFNLKGAVSKGKQFKTDEMKSKIESVLNLALLDHEESYILDNWPDILKESPLIKFTNNKSQIKDGFREDFEISFSNDEFVATTSHTKKSDE